MVLINSDFDIGYEINREVLHREIVDAGVYSSYEPCIYPGVNAKYYWNEDYFDNGKPGVCMCKSKHELSIVYASNATRFPFL